MFTMVIAVCLSLNGAGATCSLVGQAEKYKSYKECHDAIPDKVTELLEDKSVRVPKAECIDSSRIIITRPPKV